MVVQAAKLAQLCKPNKYNLDFLQKWLIGEEEGDVFLKGAELLNQWTDEFKSDYVTLSSSNS